MRVYGVSTGYSDAGEDASRTTPDILVTINVVTNDDVDPHAAMETAMDAMKDFLQEIHSQTDCAHTTPEERSAALSALFLFNDDNDEDH